MKKIQPDWHYPRSELANNYLDLFEIGLTSARGLFARRRMGKTEFLKKDLIPAAEKRGYKVVYANLWDLEDDPAITLISYFYQSISPKGFNKIWDRLKSPIKKIKLSGKLGLAEGTAEAEVSEKNKVTGTVLMEAMKVFDKTKGKFLVIIDEAQVLAYGENSHFAHALRSALDTRKDRIKVIFAGSSENTLRKMFGIPSEPFYNWAPLESFELLGPDFVKSMVERVNHISKFPLNFAAAIDAFGKLKNTPEFFRRFIEFYLNNPMLGVDNCLNETKGKLFNDENFQSQWKTLLPADQIILQMIANEEKDLHGRECLKKISDQIGVDNITKSTIQNSLSRLTTKNIITKINTGVYQLEDEAFADWLVLE